MRRSSFVAKAVTGYAFRWTVARCPNWVSLGLRTLSLGWQDDQSSDSRRVPGPHFIGEVVDVTGWLGGFNFQWAWALGFAAGSAV